MIYCLVRHRGHVTERLRVFGSADSSISHPFASLVVTFRFLEQIAKLATSDRWFARLGDAYLEPWCSQLAQSFEPALCVGSFAHASAEPARRPPPAQDTRQA